MDVFRIRDFEITNRLFVGTGKYQTYELMQQALDASGCQVVTVAVRRERLVDKEGRSLLDFLDLSRYVILPNTAGCFSADDAIRVAMLGRELLEKQKNPGAGWVKLEVLGDKKTLLPDPVGTIEATRELVKDGDPDYPVIVDAGVGTPSDVTVAMECGADGVLLNTGVAHAKDPVRMAQAMKHAIEAGRLAYLSGR